MIINTVPNNNEDDNNEDEQIAEDDGMECGVKVSYTKLDKSDDKPANVWGGANLSEKEDNVQKLGKKHRLNTRLERISNQTEIEKAPTVIIYQTLSIWLGIQFREGYGQIKDRRPNIFF